MHFNEILFRSLFLVKEDFSTVFSLLQSDKTDDQSFRSKMHWRGPLKNHSNWKDI